MIAEELENYDNNNIFIMQPIKNTLINQGLFYKLLYSNNLFTTNGIYIKLDFKETQYINNRLYYDLSNNKNQEIFNKIINVEKYLLQKVSSTKKNHCKIFEQLKNGNVKSSTDNPNIILKISGIWENENSIGISFKIISINTIKYLR